jgi:hypothetical protein
MGSSGGLVTVIISSIGFVAVAYLLINNGGKAGKILGSGTKSFGNVASAFQGK